METTDNSIPFTMGMIALKLLGKGLYSNLWSALSELISNGIDAGGDVIYTYIDMSDKKHSCIEVFDNGSGMTKDDLKNKYVFIGFNKRKGLTNESSIMGRKGIGKLAALFLSKSYCVKTKSSGITTNWIFESTDDDQTPSLKSLKECPCILDQFFDLYPSGTIIKLLDVDFSNIGEEVVNGLSKIMGDYFLYDHLSEKKIGFFLKQTPDEKVDFSKPKLASKTIAYGNMISILSDDPGQFPKHSVSLPLDYQESFPQKDIVKECKISPFLSVEVPNENGGKRTLNYSGFYYPNENDKTTKIPYALTGWIGIHASIDDEEAKKNDKKWYRGRYYSPTRLRLFIRNKLAVADFLPYLKNSQVGINYIEGEISFDLLDDSRLDDITTSSRQDVDIHDRRVQLLIDLLRPYIQKLINDRNVLVAERNEENKQRKEQIQAEAKKNASQTLKEDLKSRGYNDDTIKEIVPIIDNKYVGSGDVSAKEKFKVFLSHSRKDCRFIDFIYYFLLSRGAVEADFFYTKSDSRINSKIQEDIKENLTETNEKVVFFESAHFRKSDYCLFEGGAFWATRSTDECIHIVFSDKWVPVYLDDGSPRHAHFATSTKIGVSIFSLDGQKYKEIVSALNLLISHLNKSSTHFTSKIKQISAIFIPDAVELQKMGKSERDFMDPDFLVYWETYVVEGKSDKTEKGDVVSKEEYVTDYNKDADFFLPDEKK